MPPAPELTPSGHPAQLTGSAASCASRWAPRAAPGRHRAYLYCLWSLYCRGVPCLTVRGRLPVVKSLHRTAPPLGTGHTDCCP